MMHKIPPDFYPIVLLVILSVLGRYYRNTEKIQNNYIQYFVNNQAIFPWIGKRKCASVTIGHLHKEQYHILGIVHTMV